MHAFVLFYAPLSQIRFNHNSSVFCNFCKCRWAQMQFGTLYDDVICEEPNNGMFGNPVCISIVQYYNGYHQWTPPSPPPSSPPTTTSLSPPPPPTPPHHHCFSCSDVLPLWQLNYQRIIEQFAHNAYNAALLHCVLCRPALTAAQSSPEWRRLICLQTCAAPKDSKSCLSSEEYWCWNLLEGETFVLPLNCIFV